MSTDSVTPVLRETLDVFDRTGTPRTTTEVANDLDLGRRSTFERLERLVDHDELATKKVGANGRVWWRPVTSSPATATATTGTGGTLEDDRPQLDALVDAVEEYAIFMLDPDGRVRTWNTGASRLKGYERDEILGTHFSVFYTEEDQADGRPAENLAAARTDGSVVDEGWRVRKDGTRFWAHVTITTSRDDAGEVQGYAKVTRDMTEQRAHERQYERQLDELESELRAIFDRISDGFYALDDEFRFSYVNERAEELLDLDESSVRGEDIREEVLLTDEFDDALHEAVETGEPVFLQDYYEPAGAFFENALYPSESGVSVYFRDVTERTRRERELERYVGVIEAIGEPVYQLDSEGCFSFVNDAFLEETGYDEAELIGQHVSLGMDGEAIDRTIAHIEALLQSDEKRATLGYDIRTKDGEVVPIENRFTVLTDDDGRFQGTVGAIQNISERRDREQALELYETIVSTIDDGVYVLDEEFDFVLANDAYVEMTGYDREELLGAHCTLVVDEEVSAESARRLEALAADGEGSGSATLEADILRADGSRLRAESNFTALPGPDPDHPWKIGVVRDTTERYEYEQQLEDQRAHLAALNNLHDVVRDVTDAVFEQSTREEIEQIVCEHLAGSDSYAFACIGEADTATQTIRLRSEAGDDSHVDDVDLANEPGDARAHGPAARALRTSELQVIEAGAGDTFDDWCTHASGVDVRSVAAVPITHGEVVYGVLCVYTERTEAFTGEERGVVGQLGEIVGHAIAAVERKRALTSDQVTEIEFRITDIFSEFTAAGSEMGTVSLDQYVPIGEGEYLAYGTANADTVDSLEAFAGEALPFWRDMRVVDEGTEAVAFECRLTEPPVLSVVTAHNGTVDGARIDDGAFEMTIQLPPAADVGVVIERVRTTYPGASILAKRQVTRTRDETRRLNRTLTDALTDRQRTALDAAFYAGFFEWPRESTAEEVATSLDISAPTFHQHMRKAQQKIFTTLYESPSTTRG